MILFSLSLSTFNHPCRICLINISEVHLFPIYATTATISYLGDRAASGPVSLTPVLCFLGVSLTPMLERSNKPFDSPPSPQGENSNSLTWFTVASKTWSVLIFPCLSLAIPALKWPFGAIAVLVVPLGISCRVPGFRLCARCLDAHC